LINTLSTLFINTAAALLCVAIEASICLAGRLRINVISASMGGRPFTSLLSL